jgi:hypothetical protein
MPIWLLTLIQKTGIPSRFAKVAAWIVIAIAFAIGIFLIWLAAHTWLQNQRDDAVALDRADISAEVANRVIEADRSANANATQAAAVDQQNEKELDDAIAQPSANTSHTASVLERMRQQQKQGKR